MGAKEYKSIEELVADIKTQKSECLSWFNEKKNISSIIRHSVGSNTFRAFKGNPSVIFREWANGVFKDSKVIQSIIALCDEDNFNEMNLKICTSLKTYWDKYLEPLSIYKARKMVNLLLKEMVLLKDLSYEEKQKFIKLLHIPIDYTTLQAIRIIFNSGEFQNDIGSIPKDARMGYVDNDNKYNTIQEFFKIIAKQSDVPPIYFDVLLWNSRDTSNGEVSEIKNDNVIAENINRKIISKTSELTIYTYDEFIESDIYNTYTHKVKAIVKCLIEKVSLLNIDFRIKQRKGAFAITHGTRTKDNIITAWIGKEQINIEFYGQEKNPYYNVADINDILIEKIHKKFTTI